MGHSMPEIDTTAVIADRMDAACSVSSASSGGMTMLSSEKTVSPITRL
jgi:hypothetical protein